MDTILYPLAIVGAGIAIFGIGGVASLVWRGKKNSNSNSNSDD